MVALDDEIEVLTGQHPISVSDETAERERIASDLGTRYEVTRYISRGGFATVWEVYDRVERRDVALKRLDPKPSRRGDFYRELRAMFRLNHPNVVRLVNILETDNGSRYLFMELCKGSSLRVALSRTRRRSMPWPVERVNELVGQMAAGLHAAHAEGMTHRDIKPENALFAVQDNGDFGGRSAIKLVDFGLASGMNPLDDGRLRNVTGSPAYMAPEQFCGRFGPASDVYALGIVAFELLTGDVPFHGFPNELGYKHLNESPTLPSDLPEPWASFLPRMLAKTPEARPTAREIVEHLPRPRRDEKEAVATTTPKVRSDARPQTMTVIAERTVHSSSLGWQGHWVRVGRTTYDLDGREAGPADVTVEPVLKNANGQLTCREGEQVLWQRPFDLGSAGLKCARMSNGEWAVARLHTRPELVWLRPDGTEKNSLPLPGIPWQMVAGEGFVLARILTGRGFRLFRVDGGTAAKLSQSAGSVAIATDLNRACAVWPTGQVGRWDERGRPKFCLWPDWPGVPKSLAVKNDRWAVLTQDENTMRLTIARWPTGGESP